MLKLDEPRFYNNPDNFYSRSEVCGLLNISDSYLSKLTSNEQIPFVKLGKFIQFPKSEIDQYIEEKVKKVHVRTAIKNLKKVR